MTHDSRLSSIRAVFFDVGWTLAYPRASIWETFADLSAGRGVSAGPAACEQLIKTITAAAHDQAVARFHGGATYSDSDEEFAAIFEQMGALMFGQLGLQDERAELMREFFARFWNADNWGVFPDVIEVLRALRARGMTLGVLSNAPSNLPAFLDRLGLAPHLDFAVVSAIEGVKKPDGRIFAAALSRAGVAPHEALHVGDMYLEDIIGGRAAGLHTLLMERNPHSLFPSYRESEGRALDPGDIVSTLFDVLGRLA